MTTALARNGRIDTRAPLAFAAVVSAALIAVFAVRDDAPVWRITLVLTAVVAVTTWLAFGVGVRRAVVRNSVATSSRRTLAFGVGTLVAAVLVFWLVVPPVLASAAFALATHARSLNGGRMPRPAAAGIATAGVGLVVAVVLSVAL